MSLEAVASVASKYKGVLHGEDQYGRVDVEFPCAHQAAAFSSNFLTGQVMMRQEWAPGVEGHSVNIDFPVVLTFQIDRFSV
ncbi:hypothetical protein ABZ714_13140 [Streptomyces sp. NPDC006798]|uniref:hypothetical protein n=1 Tax=Streptomyces sp. NPDC006798 TaxID=3155462 RepID=UPI0033FB70F1